MSTTTRKSKEQRDIEMEVIDNELPWDGFRIPPDWPTTAQQLKQDVEMPLIPGIELVAKDSLVLPLAMGLKNSPRGIEQLAVMHTCHVYSRYLNKKDKDGNPNASMTRWHLLTEFTGGVLDSGEKERRPIVLDLRPDHGTFDAVYQLQSRFQANAYQLKSTKEVLAA